MVFGDGGLWEVIRSPGWSPRDGISALYKRRQERVLYPSFHYVRTGQEDHHLQTRRRVLTRTWPCWHPDLRLSSLQNCEKQISVVWARGPQTLGCGPVPVCGLLGIQLHSRRWVEGGRAGRQASEASSAAPHRSHYRLNHPPRPPGLWKNCLPQNQSPVPIRLGTTGLSHPVCGILLQQLKQTKVTWNIIHDYIFFICTFIEV